MNNEKTYKLMSVIGAGNLALGIVVLVAGIVRRCSGWSRVRGR